MAAAVLFLVAALALPAEAVARTPQYAPSVTLGCTNDSTCLHGRGSTAAWRCVRSTAAGSAPCHINGKQSKLPSGAWAWPGASCACTASSCCKGPTPAPPPPAGLGYGCAAGRCLRVEHGGTANSSGSCEWATGCVAPHANEWIAAASAWRRNSNGSLTCSHVDTFLKKSELPSGGLPPSQKLAVAQGAVVELASAPKAVPGTKYWLLACAPGSLCATPFTVAAPVRLPSYLMIGDSISLGYLPAVVKQLAGKFEVVHSAGNAGNINKISHDLDCFLSQVRGSRPSVVTVNAGIHDLARGQEWLSLRDYEALLSDVMARLVVAADRVIFVTTTPVPSNKTDPNGTAACPEGILEKDVQRYNSAAAAVAHQHNASVLDLHRVVVDACGGHEFYSSCAGVQEPENPHFLDKGWALLATAVSEAVENSVSSEPPPPVANFLSRGGGQNSALKMDDDTALGGPVGLYHPYNGRVYAAEGVTEDSALASSLHFGIVSIYNNPKFGNFSFRDNVELHCRLNTTNLIYLIIAPGSEGGVVSNDTDTALWEPQAHQPGMLQGMNRASRLAQICPKIAGVIIDDFVFRNYVGVKGIYNATISNQDLRDFKAALLGKPLLPAGGVDHAASVQTPGMRLFGVLYNIAVDSALPKGVAQGMFQQGLDGVMLWFIRQDCPSCASEWPAGQKPFPNFEDEMKIVKRMMPANALLMVGAYYNDNSCTINHAVANQYELCSASGFLALLEGCLTLFDDGTLAAGAVVYWGCGLSKDCEYGQNRSHWEAVALPSVLARRVYPNLGSARLTVVVAGEHSRPIGDALVGATYGRGHAPAARMVSNASGVTPSFGGWVGAVEAQTHTLTVTKAGFKTQQLNVQLVVGRETHVVVQMQPATESLG